MKRLSELQSPIRIAATVLLIVAALGIWATVPLPKNVVQAGTDTAQNPAIANFSFDGDVRSSAINRSSIKVFGTPEYSNGLRGQALKFSSSNALSHIVLNGEQLGMQNSADFAISFWVRTTCDSSNRMVLVSQKSIPDNSLQSQKKKGWVFEIMNGTWAWNIGSGRRRLTYQRSNGQYMPINDGRWHQLAMSYDSSASLIRLYFDGVNWVTYNVTDSVGFDFDTSDPIEIGWSSAPDNRPQVLPLILQGQEQLQTMVDSYHDLGMPVLKQEELVSLVTDPEQFIEQQDEYLKSIGVNIPEISSDELNKVISATNSLMQNPYTVHQVPDFMKVARLTKAYRIQDGKVEINQIQALRFTGEEQLDQPEFEIDELSVWNRAVSSEEVLKDYTKYFQSPLMSPKSARKSLTAASFNIHHGGIHETIEEDGWDSRDAIADLINQEGVDVVMMQETYSHGDYIAAKLGYYLATTVDWDYLNQGANISVLSRYPIKELFVPPGSPFMNVCALVQISESQEIFVMSNWYGMNNFADVYNFHESRFSGSDNIPILFGGDFNAVPHLDGGRSEASETLIAAGFTDAYRSLHPDVEADPAPTHRSGRRIDQIYYKGAGLKNTSTDVLSTWPSVFPSDHYLIKSVFELQYSN